MSQSTTYGLMMLVFGLGMMFKRLRKREEDKLLQSYIDKGVALSYPVMRTSTALDVEQVVATADEKKRNKSVMEKTSIFPGPPNVGSFLAEMTYKISLPAATAMVGMGFLDYVDRTRKNAKLRKQNAQLANAIDRNLQIGWELIRYKKKIEKGELGDETPEGG